MSANLFDAAYYRALNPDLTTAGLTTNEQLLFHFQNVGLNEGRAFSPVVDLDLYRSLNPDLTQAGLTTNRQLFEHLQNSGVAENRRFSSLVDLDFYLAKNQDVSQSLGNSRERALEHLQSLGIAEGRQFSPSIDLDFYAAKNPDVLQASQGDRLQMLLHLKDFGIAEKRLFSPLVNLNYYLAANPDVSSAFGGDRFGAFRHLETNGIAEQRRFSLVFDPTYYRQANPDLAAAGLNNEQLLEHFASFGVNEGRRGSENFDVRYYLENSGDLKAVGFNYQQALQHAMLYGWQERRPSSPGHTLNEPVVVWKQNLNAPSVNLSSINFSFDNSGNIVLVRTESVGSPRTGFINVLDYVAKYDSLTGNLVKTPNEVKSQPSPDNLYLFAFDSGDNLYGAGVRKGLNAIISGNDFVPGVLTKYDNSNTQLWVQSLTAIPRGSLQRAPYTNISGLSVDKAGNAFLTGSTEGNLAGKNPWDVESPNSDAWVAKYDTNGTQQWLRQLGTSTGDTSNSIAMDNIGNIYIAGNTTGNLGGTNAGSLDIWMAKYDSLTGTQQWLQQLGSSGDDSLGAMVLDSAGNIYIAGNTTGDLGGTNAGNQDIWVAKYDSLTGTQQWLQHLGSATFDTISTIGLDNSGNLYVTGQTEGNLAGKNAGAGDIWLAKYDSLTGAPQWLQQFGSSFNDLPRQINFDNAGNVYIESNIGEGPNVVKYNSSGTQQWLLRGEDYFKDITVDGAGNIYASANTSIAKYSAISTFF